MTKKQLYFWFVISFVWMSVTASIYGQTENEFTVSITDAGDGVVITGYTGRQGKINIPTVVQGLPVKEIGADAFQHYVAFIGSEHPSLTEITIPEGVTIIGSGAFSDCTELRKVSLPSSLKEIKWSAFNNCTKLASIEIPDGVEIIGERAFSSCENLITVKMPKNLKKIAEETFARNRRLKSIVIYDGVIIIGERAFASCPSLETIVFPSTISEIQRSAFNDCVSLVTVTIPDVVTTIKFGLDCFEGCKKTNIASQAALRRRGYKDSF